MKRPCAALGMMKNEAIFVPFWLKHYTQFFDPSDLYVHSDGSIDDTEAQIKGAGVNFYAVPSGTIMVGKNDKYVKGVITKLLESYECVLFAESPDDILVPGPLHGCDLLRYIREFQKSSDTYRFLTGINIIQHENEAPYDPNKGTLLSQRNYAVRCSQYDNPFLWKTTPLWGKGWHDLGAGRIDGGGDKQGEDKRLYNLHIHYADFALSNARHTYRKLTYNSDQQNTYMCRTDEDLRKVMTEMIEKPSYWFSNGHLIPVEDWMRNII